MHGKEKVMVNSMLFATALFWGSSYAFRKMGLAYMGAFFFNSCRFFVGFLIVISACLISRAFSKKAQPNAEISNSDHNEEKVCKPLSWQVGGGILVGAAYCLAANAQQLGLATSNAGKCGFITSLYIIFIPLFCWIVFKKKVASRVWIGALLAIVGLFLISSGTDFKIASGELLFLLAAVLFAVQIIMIGHFVAHSDPLLLVSVELLTGSVISLVFSLIFEQGQSWEGLLLSLVPVLYTGVFSLGVANVLQFIAQKKASPSLAAIILSLESVFGAIFGAALLGEQMSFTQIFGCLFILSAVLISQFEKKQLPTV